jgi:hypothetical protein
MDESRLSELAARIDRWRRRFPAGTCCADCGQANRLVLCRHGSHIVCHGCRLARKGQPPYEDHHVGGRPSSLVVSVPANLHRLLTVLQDLWRGTFEPGSPNAVLIDLFLLRVLGPSFRVEP